MFPVGYELEVPRKPRGDVSPVAKWVRAVRGKLTQDQFAEQLGMDRTTIADWERDANEPEPPSVRRILARFPDAPPYPTKVATTAKPEGFLGVSDLDRTSYPTVDETAVMGGFKVNSPQAAIVGRMLDLIADEAERNAAMDRCREAILHPHRLGAGKRPDRTQRR